MTYQRTLLCAALLAIGLGCSARSERAADPGGGSQDSTVSGAGECLSNAQIVQLVGRGEPDAVIIARITGSATCFDVSAAEVVTLRNAGVSPAVIAAMSRAARQETD